LPAFIGSAAGFGALLAAVLPGVFASALRAEAAGARFARGAAEGFDFAEIFFDLAAALAMAF